MKAVNWNVNHRGDDVLYSRLLSVLAGTFPYPITKVKKLRDHVFLLETGYKHFILKGFSSFWRLQLQEAFTASLRAAGFHHSYLFYRFSEQPVYFNKRFCGFIEYIEPHEERFSYAQDANRKEGLWLLGEFHQKTKRLARQYETVLPRFHLYEKWTERKRQFEKNLPVIRKYLQNRIIDELLEWGNASLEGMRQENMQFGDEEPPTILHGDVAHHNYLRAKSGKLYLLDFDLISIGHESVDLLQYANRILPFIHWSFHRLAELEPMQKYLQNRAFLYALMYPTDVYREWNRIIKEKAHLRPDKLLSVIELTTELFPLRGQFIKQLQNMVK
jgi:thiamine kinase-like enzyme